jgi:SAM-dependent methyltransferase
MKNAHAWKPTKFNFGADGRLEIPAPGGTLAPGSILCAGLVAHWYRKILGHHATGQLLELGAGKVPLYGLYRSLVTEVVCADWQQSLHGQDHIDFSCNLEDRVPLPDESVDTVIMSDVLEHLYLPQRALAEVHRILRPGGCAILNVPFIYWVHEEPHDYHRYTQYALKRMATEAGFKVEVLDTIGGELYVIADVLGKFLQRFGPPGQGLADGLQRSMLNYTRELPVSAQMPLFIGVVLRRPQ